VQSNDEWLKHSENLYREEQKRIGVFARECREKAGMSLRELARRMKVSAPFLSDLERGNRHWTDGTLTAWEACLQSKHYCGCSFAQKAVGDGCSICNPELASDCA